MPSSTIFNCQGGQSIEQHDCQPPTEYTLNWRFFYSHYIALSSDSYGKKIKIIQTLEVEGEPVNTHASLLLQAGTAQTILVLWNWRKQKCPYTPFSPPCTSRRSGDQRQRTPRCFVSHPFQRLCVDQPFASTATNTNSTCLSRHTAA